MRRIALLAAIAAGALTAAPALAQNADFRINNGLPIAINEIYVSSSGQAAWGSDLMGDRVLAPGGMLSLSVPAGQCMNDIKLVLANGSVLERLRLDTCNLTDVNVTP